MSTFAERDSIRERNARGAAERELQETADALFKAVKKQYQEVRASHFESAQALRKEFMSSQIAARNSVEEQYRSAVEHARLLRDEVICVEPALLACLCLAERGRKCGHRLWLERLGFLRIDPQV